MRRMGLREPKSPKPSPVSRGPSKHDPMVRAQTAWERVNKDASKLRSNPSEWNLEDFMESAADALKLLSYALTDKVGLEPKYGNQAVNATIVKGHKKIVIDLHPGSFRAKSGSNMLITNWPIAWDWVLKNARFLLEK